MHSSLLDARHTSEAASEGPIRPGMHVLDRRGEHLGTACALYRDVLAEIEERPGELYVEVKTGLLGLGPRYFIPLAAFREASEERAVLTKSREELDQLGFDRLPPFVF